MRSLPSVISISRVFCAIAFYTILDRNPLPSIVPLLVLITLIEFSDFLDGFLARKLNATSDVGKLLDPVCDISSHFLCLFALQKVLIVPHFTIIIFVLREIWVTFLRAILAKHNIILAAKMGGKIKTVLYAMIIYASILLMPQTSFAGYADGLLFYFILLNYLTALVSIASGFHYFLGLKQIKNI